MNKTYTVSAHTDSAIPASMAKIELEGRPWHTKAFCLKTLKAMAEADDLKAFLAGQEKKAVLKDVFGVDEPTEFAMLAGDVVFEGAQYYTMAGFAADGQLVLFTCNDEQIQIVKDGEGGFSGLRFDEAELANVLGQIKAL